MIRVNQVDRSLMANDSSTHQGKRPLLIQTQYCSISNTVSSWIRQIGTKQFRSSYISDRNPQLIEDRESYRIRTLSDIKLSPNRELRAISDSESVTHKRDISVHFGYVSISNARKPKVTEDGSPGINDPDGAIQEYGIQEHRRKQDSFLENRAEKRNTHT